MQKRSVPLKTCGGRRRSSRAARGALVGQLAVGTRALEQRLADRRDPGMCSPRLPRVTPIATSSPATQVSGAHPQHMGVPSNVAAQELVHANHCATHFLSNNQGTAATGKQQACLTDENMLVIFGQKTYKNKTV